jgi:hypothetical protein
MTKITVNLYDSDGNAVGFGLVRRKGDDFGDAYPETAGRGPLARVHVEVREGRQADKARGRSGAVSLA